MMGVLYGDGPQVQVAGLNPDGSVSKME